ncbi:LOW QUALITY PROTEIN: hypothetical protein PanWU01x14_000150 [Parasponia andersonii]|uniref:Uncharacterized protein n=1 Tax=Parasponia andersonii TaxID=3476 RepID=A0A2P5E4K8_PARAD|nr:LOW QUALITY PROTEIN: hypothetical protein PanWU01x14_000150 [Parasponia andersonii]
MMLFSHFPLVSNNYDNNEYYIFFDRNAVVYKEDSNNFSAKVFFLFFSPFFPSSINNWYQATFFFFHFNKQNRQVPFIYHKIIDSINLTNYNRFNGNRNFLSKLVF